MKKHIVIVGAGISGLTLGYYLKNRYGSSINLTILEKEKRVGGWVKTIEKNGFLFDTGPRSCRTRGAGKSTLRLVEALGLNDEVVGCSPQARHRYLCTGGKLHKLPSTLLGACFSPITRGFLPTVWKEWSTPPQKGKDESIAEFISRRFSPEFAANLFDPLTLGIYAGDIHTLSMEACFPEMVQWEKQYGSIIKGMLRGKESVSTHATPFVTAMSKFPIITFKQGMETLVRSLEAALAPHIKVGLQATEISPTPMGVSITTPDGEINCDRVFLTIPPHALGKAIPSLDVRLEPFHATSVATVHMGWDQKVLPKEGFGYLIPSKEKEPLLGVIFDSSAFPHQNDHEEQTRMTAMLGGARGIDVMATDESTLKSLTLSSLQTHMNIDIPPDVITVCRAPMAIPQYSVGHTQRVNGLKAEVDALFKGNATLLGSSWQGVSINDCIREAETLSSTTEL